MKALIFLISSLLLPFLIKAQTEEQDKEYSNIAAIVFLDSFVVTAKKQGFNVDEFIQIVQEDESFYEAFRNLRKISYQSENHIEFFDKKEQQRAKYRSLTQQTFNANCRSMKVLEEHSSGNFYKKKKKYRYYTAKMYDQVFFTHGKVCETKTPGTGVSKKGIQKHISELKKLIFQPGQEVDVPIIGKKTAIFDPKMMPFYDYSISSLKYKDKIDCYAFTAQVKEEFLDKKEGKTIIKYLETYFEKETFQVLGRKYSLLYKGALFDFDVKMHIELTKRGQFYLPEYIKYQGEWNIPTKKPENGFFEVKFLSFQ